MINLDTAILFFLLSIYHVANHATLQYALDSRVSKNFNFMLKWKMKSMFLFFLPIFYVCLLNLKSQIVSKYNLNKAGPIADQSKSSEDWRVSMYNYLTILHIKLILKYSINCPWTFLLLYTKSSRCMREDGFTCRGHPYMFIIIFSINFWFD